MIVYLCRERQAKMLQEEAEELGMTIEQYRQWIKDEQEMQRREKDNL